MTFIYDSHAHTRVIPCISEDYKDSSDIGLYLTGWWNNVIRDTWVTEISKINWTLKWKCLPFPKPHPVKGNGNHSCMTMTNTFQIPPRGSRNFLYITDSSQYIKRTANDFEVCWPILQQCHKRPKVECGAAGLPVSGVGPYASDKYF